MTVDEALNIAVIHTLASKHGIAVSEAAEAASILAAEVRRLRDEVNGLTGSADQASAWQEAVEDIASYMSVGVEGCDPVEAAARIKKTSDDFVQVAVQRAERAEAAIAPMVETAQNQQEEIHRLWVTFSKAAEILGLDPQKERRIPRPPSDTFTQAISRLVAERDVALAALKEAQEQGPVAWLCGKGVTTHKEYAEWFMRFTQEDCTPLYARPVPAAPAVAVPAVPTDEQIHAAYRKALGQSIRERDMPEIRKFARALLQSTGDKK